MSAEAAAPDVQPTGLADVRTRALDNIRGGNLGSWPVLVACGMVVLVFSLTAQNFFTPVNFTNLIGQMAGTCMLAYGVVFVLLIGEIDLSIAFVSGIAGMIVAELQLPTGAALPGIVCIILALLATTFIGFFQGSIVAYVGVPSFIVTTYSPWKYGSRDPIRSTFTMTERWMRTNVVGSRRASSDFMVSRTRWVFPRAWSRA